MGLTFCVLLKETFNIHSCRVHCLHQSSSNSLLLLGWAVFGYLLLSRVQPCVVTSIIPRHHHVLEALVLHCQKSECFECQCFSTQFGSNACHSEHVPVPRIAWGIEAASTSSCAAPGVSTVTGWPCPWCSEVFGSYHQSDRDRYCAHLHIVSYRRLGLVLMELIEVIRLHL